MQRPRPRSRDSRALLIDAMGTLVRLEDPVARLRVGLRERLGIEVDEPAARAALRAEVAYYRAHMQQGRDETGLAALRRRCADELARSLGSPAPEADPALMTEVLLASLHFGAYPDAPELLRRVRAAGSRIVVVSNWDVSLVEALEQTGLAPLLDGVIISAAVGARKPDAAIFEAALALADAAPEQAVHVGDSPAEDVAGALACGIRPVLLDRSATAAAPVGPRPPKVISDLAQLAWP